jgi:hypothetical protein
MAAVEHSKNQAEAEKHRNEQALKVHLLERAHKQKVELKSMELDHKAGEAHKDRMHEAGMAKANHMATRQNDVEDANRARGEALQDALMNRHHAVQDQAQANHHELKNKLLTEQLVQSRPKPSPAGKSTQAKLNSKSHPLD